MLEGEEESQRLRGCVPSRLRNWVVQFLSQSVAEMDFYLLQLLVEECRLKLGWEIHRVCESLIARIVAPNQALQQTPYPVTVLILTEDF